MKRKPAGLIWERLGRSRAALNIERIVEAAVRIADSEGAEAVSMRRIAAELGSGTMSLYRHIPGKDDLLDLMLDAAFAEIHLPREPSRKWRDNLALLAKETRSGLKRHPWLSALLSRRPPLGPHYLRYFEFSLASVAVAGLGIRESVRVIGTLYVFVMGHVGYELAEAEADRRSGLTEAQKRAAVEPYMKRVLAAGDFPNLARFLDLPGAAPDDAGFDFGLKCVLDGIAARIEKRR